MKINISLFIFIYLLLCVCLEWNEYMKNERKTARLHFHIHTIIYVFTDFFTLPLPAFFFLCFRPSTYSLKMSSLYLIWYLCGRYFVVALFTHFFFVSCHFFLLFIYTFLYPLNRIVEPFCWFYFPFKL